MKDLEQYLMTAVHKLKGVSVEEKEDPCWDGYEMVGTKMEDGEEVPNCVPKD